MSTRRSFLSRAFTTSTLLRRFLLHTFHKARLVDHVSLVRAFGDRIDAVVRLDFELEALALYIGEADFHRDFKSRRRRRGMAYIDVGTERLFCRPIQMRIDGLNASPFQKTDHESRREHA